MAQRIYLAGPITGMPDLNTPAFQAASDHLRTLGYEVFNPADLSDVGGNADLPWSFYLRRDIRKLVDCDAIVLLPGWEQSRGARLEAHIAQELGITVYDLLGIMEER